MRSYNLTYQIWKNVPELGSGSLTPGNAKFRILEEKNPCHGHTINENDKQIQMEKPC